MINECESYHFALQMELQRRTRTNPSYSLRALSRDLNISAARISRILRKKENLSVVQAIKLVERTQWKQDEKDYFLDLVRSESRSDVSGREVARVRLRHYWPQRTQELDWDAVRVLSEWYHYAIVELSQIATFRNNANWISERLGVPEDKINEAIDRLKRLKLIEIDENGIWLRTKNILKTPDGINPSLEIRNIHSELLARAQKALQTQSTEVRNMSARMIPFHTSQLPQAFELIKNFRSSFSANLPHAESNDSVYCLSLQFFRLDLPEK